MNKRQFWIIAAVSLGVLMNPINTTMISVAFARIQEQFAVGFTAISWLIASYYVISAIAQPVMGRLSDAWGSRKVFIGGLFIVTLSSLLAPLSPGIGWLMVFRGLQAVGTSALHPAGMSMLRHYVTEKQAKALGTVSVFSAASAALGPSLGGFLIHYSDWQAIFLVNFPIILVTFVLVLFAIPHDISRAADPSLLETGIHNRVPSYSAMQFLKTNVNVSLVYVQYILVNIVLYSVLFSFPTYLQNVRQLNAEQVGLVMLALSAPNLFIIPFVARWVDSSHVSKPMLLGACTLIGSVLAIGLLHKVSPILIVCLVLAILGISNGIQNLTLQTVLFQIVPKEHTGISTGLFQTSRFIGTILSTCLLAFIFGSQVSTEGLHWIAVSCTLMCIGIILLSLQLRRNRT
ncbi:MFS transporter [Paenibacillus sp. FSL H7-0331]|uniref:MFS transporter n=1 Tax=Paenibacillus sp. FSL H7-0331 TaxID=1920421 RepID=UPI00096CDADD|nr:MFS transporter [Paenibacillus sp. FSL H7-0331]OMF04323.1 hypothetical protein BK127_34265 [Paenibacillus sp. FSL H7-0331]